MWSYNDRNELTAAERFDDITPPLDQNPVPAKDRDYAYDPIGNRTQSTKGEDDPVYYCTNQLNQYDFTAATSPPCSSQPAEVFDHDEDGNLIEAPNGDAAIAPGDQVKYEWDAENRLIRVLPKAATPTDGDRKVEYTYDYMNRRVERKVYAYSSGWGSPTEHTRYIYHGWNVILELDALDSNAILKKYTWGLDLAGQNGQVNSLDAAGGIGGLLACLDTAGTPSTGDDRTFIYAYDANGNVTQLVETTTGGNYGTLAAAYEYDAYGNTVVASFGYAPDNVIRFSTRPVDPLTLLGHWPMRVLDFERGRWTTRDPASEENGANLVGWMRNQPPHAIDPLGLDWVPLNDKWDAWLDGDPLDRVLGDLGEKNPLIWFFRFLARHGASELDTFSLSNDVAVDVFSGSSAFGNLLSTVEADAHGAAGRLRCVPGVVITGAASGDQQGSDVVEWHNLRYLSGLTYIIQQLRYDASWDCYLEKRCWCCRSSDCAYRTLVRCLLRIHGWDRYDFHGNVPSDVLQWVGGSFFINWNPTFRLRPVVRTTGCADGTPAPAGAW